MKNKTQKIRKIKKSLGGATETHINIYSTTKITTEPNTDSSYFPVGLVHFSDSEGINSVRGFATGVANIFGNKGFDNTIYDKLRNNTLSKVNSLIKQNQKICSCRMDFEIGGPQLIFHHFYGTLYEKIQQPQPK